MRTPEISRRRLLALAAAAGASRAMARDVSKIRFGLTSYQWGSDWEIPTIIANCTRAKAFAVELRTGAGYRHGVEPAIDKARRLEVKGLFADSPVKLIGIASPVRLDSPDAAQFRAAVESAKAHVVLASDVGATGVRVFPNDFHPGVPQEKTIEQVGRALEDLGRFAAGHGQRVRIENHGSAGRLTTLAAILKFVEQKNVGVKLNGDRRDAEDGRFAQNFALVKHRLGDTLHMRNLADTSFPYQLQFDLLAAQGWDGWCLVERSDKLPDRVQGLIDERHEWEKIVTQAAAKA